MKSDKLRFAVDDHPPVLTSIAIALIHVLIIFDGIIFVPNVIGRTVDVPAETLRFVTFGTIIVAAVFTFLQSRRFFGLGAGFILFTGSYSAFLVCSMDAVKMGGFQTVATMSLLTVPVIFLYTFFIRFFRHIITPAVGGVVILLIAVALVPIGLELWAGAGSSGPEMTMTKLGIGGVTVMSLTVFMLFGNATLRLWSPLIAILAGYAAAYLTGQLHFDHMLHSAWFGLPPMAWPGFEWNITGMHVPLLFAFIMAMIASMIENTGNIMLVQQVSNRDLRMISYDQIQGGLYCDGLSKVVSGVMGAAVPSIYCDNLPLIEMTGVASRRVGTYGSVILLVLAFMPKVSGLVLDMPGPVIGGFLVVIASLLFHAGIRLVTMARLSNQHGIILGLSLTVGLVAEGGTYFPGVVSDSMAPMLQNSVAMGGFTAFFLSSLAYLMPKKSVTGAFGAKVSEIPRMQLMLDEGREKLKLSSSALQRLSLCCEEVFCHMIDGSEADEDRSLTFRLSRVEDGVFAEVVCGHKMEDINNFAVPDSMLNATSDELKQLGMILFSKYASDVKHVEISGYSYISFLF